MYQAFKGNYCSVLFFVVAFTCMLVVHPMKFATTSKALEGECWIKSTEIETIVTRGGLYDSDCQTLVKCEDRHVWGKISSYSPESSIEKNHNTSYLCAQTHIKQYQTSSSSVQGMHFIWPSFILVSGPQIYSLSQAQGTCWENTGLTVQTRHRKICTKYAEGWHSPSAILGKLS